MEFFFPYVKLQNGHGHGFENVTRANINQVVSSKWMNYPFKDSFSNVSRIKLGFSIFIFFLNLYSSTFDYAFLLCVNALQTTTTTKVFDANAVQQITHRC